MKTVRTTFLPNQKNKTVYFDAEETEHYFEQTRGRVTTPERSELHKSWEMIITCAYNDGFQDGIAEALARAEEELQNGKNN